MNTNILIVLSVLLVVISLFTINSVIHPFIPKTMRLQNDHPIVLSDGWTSCYWGYIAPGYGVHLEDSATIVIDKKFNGALLTINLDRPMNLRLYAVGGNVHPDEIFELGLVQSAIWPIEAVHDKYYVMVEGHENEILNLCRVSVQINR